MLNPEYEAQEAAHYIGDARYLPINPQRPMGPPSGGGASAPENERQNRETGAFLGVVSGKRKSLQKVARQLAGRPLLGCSQVCRAHGSFLPKNRKPAQCAIYHSSRRALIARKPKPSLDFNATVLWFVGHQGAA